MYLSWKIGFLMCESLETTSGATADQKKMNDFFQQNKLVESRWLAMHRRRLFCAQWSQVLQLWWINGHCTSCLPFVFFIDMHWRVNLCSRIFENSFETCNSTCTFYQGTGSSFQSTLERWINWSSTLNNALPYSKFIYCNWDHSKFWCGLVKEFPTLSKRAFEVIIPFQNTYL